MYVFNFSVVKGDTFPGNYIFQILKNSVPFDLTGATIDSDFRFSAKHSIALSMSSEASPQTIEITDAANGKFKFSEQKIDIAAGKYMYDVQITLSGKVHTYLKGEMTVLQDITT
jgi:hypothetical protein